LLTKLPQDFEGELRKLKARVADRTRRLNTPHTEVFSNPFGDFPGHSMKLYGHSQWRKEAEEQNEIDKKAIEKIERLRAQSVTELDARTTPPATALVTRRPRQHRPVDARKKLIANLKAQYPDALARRICGLIDRRISMTPINKVALAPLELWVKQSPHTRSWGGFYDDARTRNRVRSYVNKVPRLETAAKSSK
jgi:hypothetical protein